MPHITITDGLTSSIITDVPDRLSPRQALDLAVRLRSMALAVAAEEDERRAAPAGDAYERARGAYWLSD